MRLFSYLFLFFPLFSLAQNAKIDPLLLQKLERKNQSSFVVVLSAQADVSQSRSLKGKEAKGSFVYAQLRQAAAQSQHDICQYLRQQQVVFRPYWVVNAIYVEGGTALVQELAKREEVAFITDNHRYTYHKPIKGNQDNGRTMAVEWGVQRINADEVWNLGYKGQGVVIGGQDTGYDWEHPALKNQYRGWDGTTANHNYNWHDAIHQPDPAHPDPNNPCGFNLNHPCDDDEHGTHTMGTMCGLDGSNQIGVAPEAKWVGVRNMERGYGTLASYVESFEWFLAPTDTANQNPDPSKAPHVINNSWGCPPVEGCNPSNFAVMEMVVNNLRAAGVVVVVSAGNSGPNCNTVRDPAAIYASSFVVGATDVFDSITNFSSRGTVTVDSSNRWKPDVVAPGFFINSSVPGGGYQFLSGTSMAGPHVAGAVALLISANPALAGEVDSIEFLLKSTALQLTTTESCGGESNTAIPNNTYGHGRIDILKAVQAALPASSLAAPQQAFSMRCFPNPAHDKLNISIEGSPNGLVSLQCYNTLGQLVWEHSLSGTSPIQSVIEVGDWHKGMYFLNATHAQGSQSIKFVRE